MIVDTFFVALLLALIAGAIGFMIGFNSGKRTTKDLLISKLIALQTDQPSFKELIGIIDDINRN
jgi:hypothetical protein